MGYSDSTATAGALPQERVAFIKKTYLHVALALGLFVLFEHLLWGTVVHREMLSFIQSGRYAWLGILGIFMVAGWLARSLATKMTSQFAQYLGLGIYVLLEALIFLPLITLAMHVSSDGLLIKKALVITGTLFTGLSAVVLMTRKDFSFLRTGLMIGGFVAIGLIAAGAIFGFNLGLVFSGGMILLASAAILYDTSNVLHHYQTGMHVGAALELFASIALLLWYVLSFLIGSSRD